MNILNRKLIRDLLQAKGQFISVLIVVIIGVMFYSGVNAAFRNMTDTCEKYYSDYRFADLWVNFYKAPENVEKKVEGLPFVKMATGRVMEDVNISMKGENAVIRLITLPDTKQEIVNDVFVQSGSYFSSDDTNQCLVDIGFFKANGLKVGDTISPIINGTEVKLKIAGSVMNPEYIYTVKDSSELIGDNKKFGIVYVKKSFGQSVLGYEGTINNLSLTVKEGTDLEKAKDDVERLLKEFGVTGAIDREKQISSKVVSDKLKSLKAVGGAFPVIFFLVAAVIIYITMGRMVENQRTQIGVLKAFGFSDMQILTHYLSFSAFIAILGSAIGSVLGVFLGRGFTGIYNAYFNFPSIQTKVYPGLFIPASLLTLLFCLAAGYNSCKRVFRIMPSEAMRSKAPVKGKRIFVEKIGFMWNSLSYNWKMTLRNIFRYKRRAMLTSIGVIFATAITVYALGERNSVDFLMRQQYSTIQNYDIKVNFSRFMNRDELSQLKSISHIDEFEPILETGVEISNGWRKKDAAFTALISSPKMYKVTDKDGIPVVLPDDGIMVPEKLARALDVKTGDSVYIKSYLPGKEKKEILVKGIIAQYLGTSAYSSTGSINYLLGEGNIANSAVIRLDNKKNEQEVMDKLKDMAAISSVQSQADASNNLESNMATVTSAIGTMIILASVLSIAVIYNIATINIFERQRELATLKVLGFKDSEVRSLIFNENYIITVFGCLVGIPFGNMLGNAALAAFETDAYTIPFVMGPGTYVLAAAFTLGFTFIANLTLMKKIRRLDMVEVLKCSE